MQNYWTYRYAVKTMTDYYSFFNSADMGLAAKGAWDFSNFEIPFLSQINYHGILMNGESYKSKEGANGGKDIALTLVAEPVRTAAGDYMTTAVGYMVEDVPLSTFKLDGLSKKLTAMAAYNFIAPKAIVFAEYYKAEPGTDSGLSLGGQYAVADNVNLFGKQDTVKKSSHDYILQVAGIEYLWGSNLRLAVDLQQETKDGADNSKKLYFNSEIKW